MEVWLIMKAKRLKRTVLSTTVAELYFFMKCFGSCQFVQRLWMDLSSDVADIHKRTGVKNLVTTVIDLNKRYPHDLYVEKGSLFRKYS